METRDDLQGFKPAGSKAGRRIQIVCCDGRSEFDVAAFSSIFNEASHYAIGNAPYEVRTTHLSSQLGKIDLECVRTRMEPLNTLVVAGAVNDECEIAGTDAVRWLRCALASSERIVGLGAGTFLLARLGVFSMKRVVVHWRLQDRFRKLFPMLQSDAETLFAEDGRLFTCAGGVAGIDCALALVEKDLGSRVACDVAQSLLLPHRRGSDAAQVSNLLRTQTYAPDRFSQLLTWIPEHLQDDLSVKALAKRAAMSPRNFARTFRKRVGFTPAFYIEQLRFNAAQRELQRSHASVLQVAEICGFNNPETLRRTFLKRVGTTPGQFRKLQLHVGSEGGSFQQAASRRSGDASIRVAQSAATLV